MSDGGFLSIEHSRPNMTCASGKSTVNTYEVEHFRFCTMPHTPPMRVAKAGRTQRVTFAGVLLCMIAVSTTVFCVHHQFTATPRHDVSLRHPDCSYVTSAFAEQYEAMAQRPPSAPLQALRRSAASDPMAQRSWADCLPMRTVVCGVASGSQDTLFTQSPPCRSAVVHHLLVATMAAIEAQGHVAVPIGPALQHLLEHFTLPPDGTSIDVLTDAAIGNLASWFWVRGFAHFEDNATGASVTCLAPHHTLATILFGDDAPDATPPHLRWSTMQAFDDRIVLASEKSHPYRRVEMAPLGCLPLYDVSIAVPSHPTAFVKTPRSMRQHDVDIPGPSSRCKALCDDSTPRVQTHSVLNASRCSARHDTEFSARLATYKRHPQRLHLTEDHAPSLTVLTDHVSDGKVWQYCLPMLPQQCGARRGTKTTLFETPPGKPCRSAVLELLLESILELTHELDLPSFVYFGTLLGAWRDEAIIPHTPDVDVALPSETDWTALQDAMWARGVYATLVDSSMHDTPYVDLYMWHNVGDRHVHIETAHDMPDFDDVFPLVCNAKTFGQPVPSIQRPEAMFRSEYGTTYAHDPKLHLASCESYCDHQLLGSSRA